MAHDAPQSTGPSKLVIRNIGLLLSGAMEKPILDADTIVAENGKITAIGRANDIDTEGATTIVDANGTTVAPGLIDSHVHPVAGDWTPRQNQSNWIDSYLHGGVTTMISAGEVHMPGRPRDVVGLKAMAIFAQRAFWTLRPGGVKVHAGAPVIECEMVEDDFKEMAAAGVKLLGEVGLGGVKDGPTARKMVGWARKYGIQSTIHTGGPSIPGSGLIDKDVVLEADTDVVGHINGGHTALPDDQIRCICEGCKRGLELVHNGNERSALFTLRTAREMGGLAAVVARRHSSRDRLLLCHRQHRPNARARLRPDRNRPLGGFRHHGPRPAFARQEHSPQRRTRRFARHRHDHHRRHHPHAKKPQHPAGGESAGDRWGALTRSLILRSIAQRCVSKDGHTCGHGSRRR
jgi:enamidase